MTKTKELLVNTAIIMLGKLCTQLITFLLLPIYTSILSSEEYGLVDLITTYSALAIPLVGFQFEMGVFRFLIDARKDEQRKKELISSSFIVILASTLLLSMVFWIISHIINLDNSILILLSTVSMLFSGYLLQVARGNGDNIGFSVGSIITGIATITLNIISLKELNMGIPGILISSFIANVACILYLALKEKVYRYIRANSINKQTIAELFHYSLPLVPNSLIWWVINVSDRTIISVMINASANGIYAVSNKFPTIISSLFSIFNLSWTESASLHFDAKDRDSFFSSTFNTSIRLFACITLLMIASMPIVFNIFIHGDYGEASLYVPILALSTFFNVIVSFIGSIYIAKKKTKEVAMTSLWSGILNIVINLLLIKYIGVWAAAISTLLSFSIMSIYRYRDVQKYVKLKLDKKQSTIILLVSTLCIVLYYLNNQILTIINIILIVIYSAICNRGIIDNFYKKIRGKLIG